MSQTRLELLVADLERLENERDALLRDWRRAPLLITTVVLAAPVYAIWGPTAAFYTVIAAPCLVLTALYLLAVRRTENRQLIAETKVEIEKRRVTAPHEESSSRQV